MVTPGAGPFRRVDAESVTGVRPHRLAAVESSRVVVRGRGADGGVDDWGWWVDGDQPGVGHAGGVSVVGHFGWDGVCPTAVGRGTLYSFAVERLTAS